MRSLMPRLPARTMECVLIFPFCSRHPIPLCASLTLALPPVLSLSIQSDASPKRKSSKSKKAAPVVREKRKVRPRLLTSPGLPS